MVSASQGFDRQIVLLDLREAERSGGKEGVHGIFHGLVSFSSAASIKAAHRPEMLLRSLLLTETADPKRNKLRALRGRVMFQGLSC